MARSTSRVRRPAEGGLGSPGFRKAGGRRQPWRPVVERCEGRVLLSGWFRSAESLPVGRDPWGLATGDVNGDGLLDLIAANEDSNDLTLRLGRGDGGFGPAVKLAVGRGPSAVVAVDLNGDGRLDLAAANRYDDTVSLLFGRGDGTFAAPVDVAVGDYPIALAAADLDGDGRVDLVTADFAGNTVSTLRNLGGGAFAPAVAQAVGRRPSGLAVAQLDGAGGLDLAVTNRDDGTVSLLLGAGGGAWTPGTVLSVDGVPWGITAADLDGDGRVDLAVTGAETDRLLVLRGLGHGAFQAPAKYPVGHLPFAVVAGDFSGDGVLDLVVSNRGRMLEPAADSIAVLAGVGDGTFRPATFVAVGDGAYPLVAADFNRDGGLDLAVANLYSNDVSVLLNAVAGPARPRTTPGDFDRDRRTDRGVFRVASSDWLVPLSSGGVLLDARTNQPPRFGAPNLLDLPLAGDFDGDGVTDLGVFRVSTSEWLVRLSSGGVLLDARTNQPPRFGAPNLLDLPLAGDFDGDGRTDLGVFRPSSSEWLVRLSSGGVLLDARTNQPPRFGAPNLLDLPLAGDFDGDGRTDLGVFRVSTSEWLVRLSSGGVLLDPATGGVPRHGAANLVDYPLTASPGAFATIAMRHGTTARPAAVAPSVASARADAPAAPTVADPTRAQLPASPEPPAWWGARVAWWRERLSARQVRRSV